MKRIVAIFLSLSLMFCCMPMAALAEETTGGGSESTAIDLSAYSIDMLSPGEFTYNGKTHCPDMVIVGDPKTHTSLKKKQDFVVEATDNVNAGEMVLTIRGINNYCGQIQRKLPIHPKSINDCKKLGKTRDSRVLKLYVGYHSAGSTIYSYIYNSHNQKICSDKDKVYLGNTLYIGMTSQQALLTTWGRPVRKYSYSGYPVWVYQRYNRVVYVYFSGGRVFRMEEWVY